MREWTREERYRVLKDADEIRKLHEPIRHSVYRSAIKNRFNQEVGEVFSILLEQPFMHL